MIYLSQFTFPPQHQEEHFLGEIKRTCYDSFYPFRTISKNGLAGLDFETITILYGGNGSGKTTALNVMAETLGLERDTLYNRTNFFKDYTAMCRYTVESEIPKHSRIVTSDDVFDFMLNLRTMNEGIDSKREELLEDYLKTKGSDFQMKSLEDYEQLKKVNSVRGSSQSSYVRKHLVKNVREHSNGESAFLYFCNKIQDDGLYLLDEPENSLSPKKQLELKEFIEKAARFFGCQFIIATHSPFLLSAGGAKIYDMDAVPVDIKCWTELASVRTYYYFFHEHEEEF